MVNAVGNELALLFGCDTTDQMPLAMDAVGKFPGSSMRSCGTKMIRQR